MKSQRLFYIWLAIFPALALNPPAWGAQAGRRTPVVERPAVPAAPPLEAKAQLTGVRLLSSPTYTRVTMDLTESVRYEIGRLPEDPKNSLPPRIFIDISGTRLAMDSAEPIAVDDGLVRRVRLGQNTDTTVRVVLDMNSLRDHKAFLLPDPYRLVIDVQGAGNRSAENSVVAVEKNAAAAPAEAAKAAAPVPSAPERNRPAPVAEAAKAAPVETARPAAPPPTVAETRKPTPVPERSRQTASLPSAGARPAAPGIRKIVLDPGHGGRDPGAIGVDGLTEKDIVLKVARKLAAKLQKDMGIQVVLTRKDDSYVPLEDRTAIANSQDADLFISLHMNAATTPDARGLETYYLDNTTDEASIRLASRENGTPRGKISDLQFILSDMMQNSKLEDSITLAHNLQSSVVNTMSKKMDVRDLGVKKALFYVLVGARMPSVLVEMFFITNKAEGRAMAQEAYQDSVVEALYDGILKYNQSTLAVKTL
ncbi:MAG: N-acetylmuramoyl-L-alanine amidase [Deltaproteobacteria bacterium]|nr:N-acetylmuramoyl-L-alanine amidase [Deltaproteobacteria bacterium]